MKRNNPFVKDKIDFKLTVIPCGKYELECYVLSEVSTPYLFILNTETGSYNLGSYIFYMVWDIPKEIREDLLPTIDNILEQPWMSEIIVNDYTLINAIIYAEKIYFMPNSVTDLGIGKKEVEADESKQLDTRVFKEIILKWLDFLETYVAFSTKN